jgi:hypothetical protein
MLSLSSVSLLHWHISSRALQVQQDQSFLEILMAYLLTRFAE